MQWTAPTPASPFRYGGAAGPVDIDPAQAEEIARSVAAIASELDLVGLNSADFLVSDDAVWLIEINPRPGATLDVFESNEAPLFARHIAACEGRLTPASPSLAFKAAEIVYAPCDIVAPEGQNWPDWMVDRPSPGTRIAVGDPLCTTLASGATVDLARALRQRAGAENHRSRSGGGTLSDVETISVNRRAAELTAALRRDAAILNLGVARGPLGETLIDAGATAARRRRRRAAHRGNLYGRAWRGAAYAG